MSTPYSEIYDLYSGMCSDYEFLNLSTQEQDEILEGWLLIAVGEFKKCKIDLSDRDSTLKQFNQTLTDDIKNILAKGILKNWLSPKLYTIDNLKNHLSTKDFQLYSPANILKEIRTTYNEVKKDFDREKIKYGYDNFDPLKDLMKS